jgi:hypothetical protein
MALQESLPKEVDVVKGISYTACGTRRRNAHVDHLSWRHAAQPAASVFWVVHVAERSTLLTRGSISLATNHKRRQQEHGSTRGTRAHAWPMATDFRRLT